MLFLCYSKCSTCAKARAWLDEVGRPYESRDIKEFHPTKTELAQWHRLSGLPLRRFFNTSGQLYRALHLSDRLPHMGEEEQLALLAEDGMLVKRPILVDGDAVLVGFHPQAWEAHFA